MKLIIDIPEARYKDIQRIAEVQLESNHFKTAEQIIANGMPIEQEPKTDTWSIKEVADALEKHGLLEQEPCGDCVNRQTVKEQMIKYGFHAPDMTVTEFVEDLPSVNPQKNIVNNGTMNITL